MWHRESDENHGHLVLQLFPRCQEDIETTIHVLKCENPNMLDVIEKINTVFENYPRTTGHQTLPPMITNVLCSQKRAEPPLIKKI